MQTINRSKYLTSVQLKYFSQYITDTS